METSEEITLKLHEYYEAFHRKEWDKFGEYLSDNFKYFTDNNVIQEKEKFLEFLTKDKWKPKEYRIYDAEIQVSPNGDMALAAYKTSFTGMFDDNKELTIHAIETTVFIKESDGWKIIHSHTSNKI